MKDLPKANKLVIVKKDKSYVLKIFKVIKIKQNLPYQIKKKPLQSYNKEYVIVAKE